LTTLLAKESAVIITLSKNKYLKKMKSMNTNLVAFRTIYTVKYIPCKIFKHWFLFEQL